jgi:hypothetical protein
MHTPPVAPSPPLSWSSPQMAARYISGSMPAAAADDSSARGVRETACSLLHPTTRHWDLQSGGALYLNPVGSIVTHLLLSSPPGGRDHQALVRAVAPSTSPQPNLGLVVYLSCALMQNLQFCLLLLAKHGAYVLAVGESEGASRGGGEAGWDLV